MEARPHTPTGPPAPSPDVRPNAVLLVVGIGTLLSALAGSAVTLILPTISKEMNISLDQASWIMISFMLAVTVLLLIFGRAGDLFGHRKVYLGGFFLFGVASLTCGLAGSFWMLVFGRLFQGVGGAMVMATGPALLTTTFPGAQRGKALGMLATATYIGLTIGPPFAGYLISSLSWRWIFYINIPITAFLFTLGLFFLPSDVRSGEKSFDFGGAFTFVVGLPLLLLALSQGHKWGWSSWQSLVCIAFGGSLLAAFFRIETRSGDPLLDLTMFRSRTFSGATLSALANYMALFIQMILLPYFLMEALRVDPAHAGLVLSAQPLMMALVASPSGWISDRIGTRGLSVVGMAILAAGLAGMSTVGANASLMVVAIWLGVMGIGTGIFISPNSSAIMGAAPRARQGVAGGIMAMARNFGMVVGVALATLVYQASGGRMGGDWGAADFHAFSVTMCVAAVIALTGAATSALRGKATPAKPV